MIECLFWENEGKAFMGLVKNPTMGKKKTRIGKVQGITGEETEIRIEFRNDVELFDWRTKKNLGKGKSFKDRFRPWEGNLYQVSF